MSAPEGVDVATGEIAEPYRLSWEPMNRDQAKHVTTQINAYSLRLPMLVKEARDAEAWKALGCATWTEYVQDHLVISTEYARQLLRGADKLEELAAVTGVPADLFAIPERVLRAIDTPTMVGVGADALASLPAEATPEQQAGAVDAAVRERVSEQRMEEAAQRGREKAAADLAEAKVRREAAGVAEKAERDRQRAEYEAELRAERERAEADQTSDVEAPPSSPSDAPGQVPAPVPVPPSDGTPACVADEGRREGDGSGPSSAAPVTAGDAVPPAASPALPADWRTDLANACYLLRLPVALLADAMGEDDAADLKTLFTHVGDALDIYESIKADPAKEQNA